MSSTMKTRYTIIEPGPLRDIDLVTLDWVDVELETAGVHRFEAPTLTGLHRILDPLFPDAHFERVAVNSAKGPADMFVDDMGGPDFKALPVNEGATLIYWTASWMHRLAAQSPSVYELENEAHVAVLRTDAIMKAAERFKVDQVTPRIHGRAVLFDGRVWC